MGGDSLKIKDLVEELNKQLSGVFDTKQDEGTTIIWVRGKGAERFMEDVVVISDDYEVWDDKVKELVQSLTKYEACIMVDMWCKVNQGFTVENLVKLRQIIDDFAKKHNLLKVYAWGQDGGGDVVFIDGVAKLRTYYDRHGEMMYDEVGPLTEDAFWSNIQLIVTEREVA